MSKPFISYLLEGDNHPSDGSVFFESSDHMRFEDAHCVSEHNYGSHRRLIIEKNISGSKGYTVSIINLDGIHPLWQDNYIMSPKRMEITKVDSNIVEMRGYGYDEKAVALGAPMELASYENYGIAIMIEQGGIYRAQLNLYDRNISIVYLQ